MVLEVPETSLMSYSEMVSLVYFCVFLVLTAGLRFLSDYVPCVSGYTEFSGVQTHATLYSVLSVVKIGNLIMLIVSLSHYHGTHVDLITRHRYL